MARKKPAPKKSRSDRTERITVYVTPRAKQVYEMGSTNNWGTAAWLGELADEAILKEEERFSRLADDKSA